MKSWTVSSSTISRNLDLNFHLLSTSPAFTKLSNTCLKEWEPNAQTSWPNASRSEMHSIQTITTPNALRAFKRISCCGIGTISRLTNTKALQIFISNNVHGWITMAEYRCRMYDVPSVRYTKIYNPRWLSSLKRSTGTMSNPSAHLSQKRTRKEEHAATDGTSWFITALLATARQSMLQKMNKKCWCHSLHRAKLSLMLEVEFESEWKQLRLKSEKSKRPRREYKKAIHSWNVLY